MTNDLTGAVEALPDLQSKKPEAKPEAKRATRTDDIEEWSQMWRQYSGKTYPDVANSGENRGCDPDGGEKPGIVVFPGKTPENQGKSEEVRSGVEPPTHGFSVRQQTPRNPGKTAISTTLGADVVAVETKTSPTLADVMATTEARQGGSAER